MRLVFTVTNDLNYDQRMIRICNSLQQNGYDVLLVGRSLKSAVGLVEQPFNQRRIFCFFKAGKLFYLEYNLKLLFFLFWIKLDLICAIDLDTIVPCFLVSVLRGKKRVYDAHELFSEMKEVVTRPLVRWVWKHIEAFTVPHFKMGYTVNSPIQKILKQHYKINYQVILNTPLLKDPDKPIEKQNFIIYQGAVNEGRCFENLIPAFQWIDCPLWIFGDGNFLEKAKRLSRKYKVEDKVIFKSKLLPAQLREITGAATMGITIFENKGLSNYYSLANRFFDYIHAGIPQLCVDYPAYKEINDQFEVAVLLADLSAPAIAAAINGLLTDPQKRKKLSENCQLARRIFNWQNEEKKLNNFYHSIIANER